MLCHHLLAEEPSENGRPVNSGQTQELGQPLVFAGAVPARLGRDHAQKERTR